MIAELETFVKHGPKVVFVVDDNLIGNKKAIKLILREIIEWQRERGYPLIFSTEASLDLAEDEELMVLMAEANFHSVFVGIESPNEESLMETKKYQNVRPQAGSILDRVHKVQNYGLEIFCGMIMGFDHDDADSFNTIPQFLKQAGIVQALIGQLYAIPTTPLYARLAEEGRLDETEEDEYGTNVIPLKMTRQELRDGFVQVMNEVYDVEAYFDRVDDIYIQRQFKYAAHHLSYWRNHRWAWFKQCVDRYAKFAFVFWKCMRTVPHKHLRKAYRRRLCGLMRAHPFEPHIWINYIQKVALHYHYHTMLESMSRGKFGAAGSVEEVSPYVSAESTREPAFADTQNV